MRIFRKRRIPYTRDVLKGDVFQIGEYTYGSPRVFSVWQGARLKIGKFCSIAGEDVEILLGDNHRTDWVTTYPFPAFSDTWPESAAIERYYASKGDVVIGNDVWIGHRAMILSGVRIGDGAVIGARAVVAHDVEPYAVVVGNPGRTVRKRFPQEIIDRLLVLRWWDWPVDKIRKHLPLLCSGRIREFLDSGEER